MITLKNYVKKQICMNFSSYIFTKSKFFLHFNASFILSNEKECKF